MQPLLKCLTRMALALLAAAVALLLFEGVTGFYSGTSFLARTLDPNGAQPPAMATDRRDRSADLTAGPWAVDLDPLVGFRFKASHEVKIPGALAHTDAFGQRLRVGPDEVANGLRIVLLGDLVAFGHGVSDGETYAHRLEELLAEALPAQSPRPIVLTVACSGWNQS
ncbi:MAG: hypothetical protein ACI8QS_003001 [Planctomycetota bacterium]|jgi:hypothetical protein